MAGDSARPVAAGAGRGAGTALAGADSAWQAFDLVRVAGVAAALAALVLAGGVAAGVHRAWAAWLVASVGVTTAGLAGIVFVATQYASGAAWSVAFRRVPEALSAALPVGGVALLALIVLAPGGYPWVEHRDFHGGSVAAFKEAWLSRAFFTARAAVYLAVWMAFTRAIVAHSRRQDQYGDAAHSARNTRLSIGFLVAFAVSFSLASFDWIMSLEPHWYSTIFAMYNFAGLFASGLATIVLLVVWLRQGPLARRVTDDHLHDLGKLLFAFCTFWMYIWFSQYMLVWYAHIPEETTYYILRTRGAYGPLLATTVVLNWVVPFFLLLRRGPKRRPELIVKVAIVALVGRWLDLYMMIVPPLVPEGPPFGLWEVAGIVALAGTVVWVVARGLREAALVPISDPRLAESLHYHA